MTTSVNGWQHSAACTAHDPELFFSCRQRRSPLWRSWKRARQICPSAVPVRTSCLECAISIGADDGIWGRAQRAGTPEPPPAGSTQVGTAAKTNGSPPEAVLAAQTASPTSYRPTS